MSNKIDDQVCPLCGGAEEEMGSCQCGARMCVGCWQFHICPVDLQDVE